MGPIVVDSDAITYIPFRSRFSCQRAISCSQNGDMAVLAERYLCIIKLECQPARSDAKYVWTKELIRLPEHSMAYPVRVDEQAFTKRQRVFDLSNPHLKNHCDRPLLFDNKSHASLTTRSGWLNAEWSIQGLDARFKAVLLALTIDHRLVCYFKPERLKPWASACDISRLFQRYYLSHGRVPHCYEVGTDNIAPPHNLHEFRDFRDQKCLWCESMTEYFDAISDMMIVDLSWSELFRQGSTTSSDKRASFVTLHKSGAIAMWSVSTPVRGPESFHLSGVDYKHCVETTELDHLPIVVKVCDFDACLMLIVFARTDGLLLGQLYSRPSPVEDKWKRVRGLITIWDKPDDQPVTALNWNRIDRMLYVGKGPLIWIFAFKEEEGAGSGEPVISVTGKCQMTGENDLSITGIANLGRTLYVCSADGRLQEVVIGGEEASLTTERIAVALPVPRSPHRCHSSCHTASTGREVSPAQRRRERYASNWEFNGVFASRNGVVLGLLASPVGYFDNVESVGQARRGPTLALFSVWNEDKLLAFLLNEAVPFRAKRDVVEELRRLFATSRESLQPSFMRLLDSESSWPHFSWHNLQLMHLLVSLMGHEDAEARQRRQLQQILSLQQEKMQRQLDNRQQTLMVPPVTPEQNGEAGASAAADAGTTAGTSAAAAADNGGAEPSEEERERRAANQRRLHLVRLLLLGKHLTRALNLFLRDEATTKGVDDGVLVAEMLACARHLRLPELCTGAGSGCVEAGTTAAGSSLEGLMRLAEQHPVVAPMTKMASEAQRCPVCHGGFRLPSRTDEDAEALPEGLQMVCDSGHSFQRCCQTFRAASQSSYRQCCGCGAVASPLPEEPSDWRREMLTPFCPFCDGDLC